jgi:hypothetical protein
MSLPHVDLTARAGVMRTVLFVVMRCTVRSSLASSDGPQHSQERCVQASCSRHYMAAARLALERPAVSGPLRKLMVSHIVKKFNLRAFVHMTFFSKRTVNAR